MKLCFEHDDSDSLVHVRKGLFLAIQALGPSKFAGELGVNRVSLYRMLSADGNPSLRYMVRLLSFLGLRMWSVEEDFILRRKTVERPKEVHKDLDAFEEWMNAVKPKVKRKVFLSEEWPEDD